MNEDQAKDALRRRIAEQSTETLLKVARALNIKTENAEILASTFVERELEKRLPVEEFLALMKELDAELDAAMNASEELHRRRLRYSDLVP